MTKDDQRLEALKQAVDVGQSRMYSDDQILTLAGRFASFLESPMASAKSPDAKQESGYYLGSGSLSNYSNMEE
jgi:hypothetical protein